MRASSRPAGQLAALVAIALLMSAPPALAQEASGPTVHLRAGYLSPTGSADATNAASSIRLAGAAWVPAAGKSQAPSSIHVVGGEWSALAGAALDTDRDLLADAQDNCTKRSNPTQLDTDDDGFGNACDPDYNNDGVVGIPDFNLFRPRFGTTSEAPGFDPALDHNGDGAIGIPDFNVFRGFFGRVPGPSGLE